MADIDHILQQDGRVVKAPSFRGERTKYTPDMRGIEILFPEIDHRLGSWLYNSRPVVSMAGVSLFSGVRMADWLRPGLWEVLRIKLRGIEPGKILALQKSIGWADGDEKHVPLLLWLT